MTVYEVDNKPSLEKIEKFDRNDSTFYRFQNKDWEIGTKSWGMIFSTEEEAIADAEQWGYTPEEAVLDGKSCCFTAKELWGYIDQFDKDYRILVVYGTSVGEGHDGEDVVDICEIMEVWKYEDFVDYMQELGF